MIVSHEDSEVQKSRRSFTVSKFRWNYLSFYFVFIQNFKNVNIIVVNRDQI